MQELRIQEETTMKRTCGKTLTLTILAAILAGTVPAFAGDVIGQQVTVDKDRTKAGCAAGIQQAEMLQEIPFLSPAAHPLPLMRGQAADMHRE